MVMVTFVIPPFIVGKQLWIHFLDESCILSMSEYLVYCPAYQRRFAVAGIIIGRIGIDAVDDHTVGQLIVEHSPDIVFCQFGSEAC